MTLPEQQAETVGPPKAPRRLPQLDLAIDRSQLPVAAAAFGIALVSTAVALSAVYSRHTGNLDASNYTMGVLATLGLLGGAAGAFLLLPDDERRGPLVTWPGAAGVAGVGLMIAVAITKDNVSTYTASVAVIALSIGGYLLTRGAAFVLTTIAGTVVLYIQAFNDLIPTGSHSSNGFGFGDNQFMIYGAAIVVFVVAATAAGWFLAETRVLSGVVIGIVGVVTMGYLFQFLSISRQFAGSGASMFGGDTSGSTVDLGNPFENDTWVVLGLCFVLALYWLTCALVTGHVGFRLLALAITVLAVPSTTEALASRHPTWWEVGACAVGGLILVAVAVSTRDNLTRPASTAPAETIQ